MFILFPPHGCMCIPSANCVHDEVSGTFLSDKILVEHDSMHIFSNVPFSPSASNDLAPSSELARQCWWFCWSLSFVREMNHDLCCPFQTSSIPSLTAHRPRHWHMHKQGLGHTADTMIGSCSIEPTSKLQTSVAPSRPKHSASR